MELHAEPLAGALARLLPAPRMLARARPAVAGTASIAVPALEDQLVHLVAHGMLQHAFLENGRFLLRDLIEQARDAGALAYLVKPFQRSELIPAVEVALGVFKEMKALHEQTASLEEQLETRKIVDRAKGQIMDAHGLSEHEAFGFIQKRAMQERQTMKAVAERVIAGSLRP